MTIRQLKEEDREPVLRFLRKQSSLNLFMIGDIINFGFDRDFQQVWGDFSPEGELRAVLLRYFGNYIPYAEGEFDRDGLVRVILEQGNLETFLGVNG
ncbi:hypothetical protein [Paludifilum halophilum]|uniref:GNAT family N-acetyltransferase n=1 Tax=Paludifilum halophilum TaxID=1642702 RepID=A0A235B7H9_9BACL|nr:hypothetical protein [Paludifilum halophilum]OYD08268.1 hypothetical protein CHM34_05295 [Paludifilum halophilum]